MQGKQEQADEIRRRILKQKPVPWPVLTREAFITLQEKALEASGNKKNRLLAFEYALIYHHKATLNRLREKGVGAALQPEDISLNNLGQKHFADYEAKQPTRVMQEVAQYGVDHRTRFNLTPLMIATRLGHVPLVEKLVELGASLEPVGSNGLNALHMLLERALADDHYDQGTVSHLYPILEPNSLSVQVDNRLIKLDKRLMGVFVLNLMFALFYRRLGDLFADDEAFTAKGLASWVQALPEAVLPERRKKPSYISGILSSNEVNRDYAYNRKLFVRIRRGHYILNPQLKLRQGDRWVPVHERLPLEDLAVTPHKKKRAAQQPKASYRSGSPEILDDYGKASLARYVAFINTYRVEHGHSIDSDLPADEVGA